MRNSPVLINLIILT